MVPFINKQPAIFGCDVRDLQAKTSYLYQSLGGTPSMIRKFPAYFSFDLETHTRPRAEFFRALNLDPLMNGLPFLVCSNINELAQAAGVQVKIFNDFNNAYLEMWRMKKQQDELFKAVNAPLRSFPIVPIDGAEVNRFTDSMDAVLDELDFGF